MLLHRNAATGLPMRDIVSQTARPVALMESALRDLTTGGLISGKIGPGGEQIFRYDPQTDSLRTVVEELVTMYNERPVTLVRAIYDRPAQPVISFADAFRLRT